MKSTLNRALGLLMLAVSGASCSLFNLPVPADQRGSLVITAEVQNRTRSGLVFVPQSRDRTLAPKTMDIMNDLHKVRLIFKPQPSGAEVVIELEKTESPPSPIMTTTHSFQLTAQDIPAGNYLLDLEVLNPDSKVYMTGSVTTAFTVTAGISNTLPSGMTVAPVATKDGKGSAHIRIHYPADAMTLVSDFLTGVTGSPSLLVKKISWPTGGSAEPSLVTEASLLGWTLSDTYLGDTNINTGDLEVEALDLTSGQYEIRLRFGSSGIPGTSYFPYDFVETLQVYDNILTQGNWKFDYENFGTVPPNGPIAPDMGPVGTKIPTDGVSVNRVVLNWKAPPLPWTGIPQHIGFAVLRREGWDSLTNPDAPWEMIHQTGPFDETWIDDNAGAGLPADTRFDYQVYAVTFAGKSSSYVEALNMGISSGAELQMGLLDRELDLSDSTTSTPQTIELDTTYGPTPFFSAFGGGTMVPILMKNNGMTSMNVSSLSVNTLSTYVNYQVMDSDKNSFGSLSNFVVAPGDYYILVLMITPADGVVPIDDPFGIDLSFSTGSQTYMVSFNGSVRTNILHVSHSGNTPPYNGDDFINSGISASPLATIDKALEWSRDGDLIKVASYGSPYYVQAKTKIKKRVLIEGDYDPSTWTLIGGAVSSTSVEADPADMDAGSNPIIAPTFQFEDVPFNSSFSAGLSRMNIWGEGGAPAVVSLLRSHAMLSNLLIKSGNAEPGKPLSLVYAEGFGSGGSPDDFTTFDNVIFQFPYLTTAPTELNYMALEGPHKTKVQNSRFETLIDTVTPLIVYPTGPHYGIRLHPDPAKGTGDFILQDSTVEVGESTGSGSQAYGIFVNAGTPGKRIGLYRNKFRFIGGIDGNTDTAVFFRQMGSGEYKPLLESNRFYFNTPQPMVGLNIGSTNVRALVYQNLFTEAGDTSGFEHQGIIDGGTDTRIFNNTFSTRLNNSTYQPSFYWIEIPGMLSAPRVVNNLFASMRDTGSELQNNSYALRVVTGGYKPAEFRNNAYMGVSQMFIPPIGPGIVAPPVSGRTVYEVEQDLNNPAITSAITGNNRIIPRGTSGSAIYLIQEGMDMGFGLLEGTSEKVYDSALNPPWIPSAAILYGGANISQGIADWAGPLPPEHKDATLKITAMQDPTQRRSFSWPGAWTIGADEPPSLDVEARARWALDAVNAGTPQLDDQVGFFATGAYDFGGVNSGFTKDDATRPSRFNTDHNAVYFNGRSSYAVAGMPSDMVNISQGWSVGVWFGDVNFKSHPNTEPLQTLVSASDDGGALVWRLALKGNTRQILASTGGGTPSDTLGQIPWRDQYRKWNHVFAVFDKTAGTSGRVSVYLNGNPVPLAVQDVDLSAVPFEISPTGSNLAMGGRTGAVTAYGPPRVYGSPPPEFFYGKLDDVELYNRPITPAEVGAFFQSNLSHLDLAGAQIPGNQGASLNFSRDMDIGTSGIMSSVSPVTAADRYVSLWDYDTTEGIIQGEYWGNSHTAIRARSLAKTTNLNYRIRGYNNLSGALGTENSTGGLDLSTDAGYSSALKALWPFGGAGGRSLRTPTVSLHVLQHNSGAGWNNWWDPEWVPEGVNPWSVLRKEPGSVWFDGASFLRTGLTTDINIHSQPSLTAVVSFRFQGTIPGSPEILPLITWGSGISGNTLASRALSIGLQTASFHRVVVDGANGPVTFDLGKLLSPGKTYTLAVSVNKDTSTVRYFLDASTSPNFGFNNAFNYGGPLTPSDLVVGGSPGNYFKGWIDEVRLYTGDLLATTDFYIAQMKEFGEAISATLGGLRSLPSGKFQRDSDPANISEITQGLWISPKEVTRTQFSAVMGVDPSDAGFSTGTSDPVQKVNWYHAIAFSNKLSVSEGLTPVYSVPGISDWAGLAFASIPLTDNSDWNSATVNWEADGYRLPTEMEWMWAAMGAPADGQFGGVNTTGYLKAFAGSNGSNTLADYAWYNSNSTGKTNPAGTKMGNEVGLLDMSGNVSEWCWDWNGTYPSGLLKDYRGPGSSTVRIRRGGAYNDLSSSMRIDSRANQVPYGQYNYMGFRVVRK